MKFGCKTIGLFSLFLLFTPLVSKANTLQKMRGFLNNIIRHPIESTKKYGCIGIKTAVILCSGKLAGKQISLIIDHFKRNNITLDAQSYKHPFEQAVIATSLAMLAFECSDSLVDDIKSLG